MTRFAIDKTVARRFFWPVSVAAGLLVTYSATVVANSVLIMGAQAPTVAAINGTPAFPGAQGYGSISKGGRGGKIIYVTTLADSGTGSYRSCVLASGPRVCVFRVNGVIRFTQTPPVIRNPYLTIAGQTAQGGGITLSHAGGTNGRTPLVIKNTHDVIVRNIRIRTDRPGGNRGAEDGITIERASRVILDHVSASWARDELVNGYGDNNDITVSNSVFAYGTKPHDKCALLASDPVDGQRLSFIGNICAHNGDRSPDVNFPQNSCVEIVNNVFYNASSRFGEVWEQFGGTPVSFVGNSFIAGPNTSNSAVGIARDTRNSTGTAKIYLWDNRFVGAFQHVNAETEQVLQDRPPCPLTAQPKSANAAYTSVLASAGSFPRDTIDSQVVYDIKNGTGMIGQPAPVMPAIPPAAKYADGDKDGMDDAWERSVGLNPRAFDPWGDKDGDGILNFDEFLAYRDGVIGL